MMSLTDHSGSRVICVASGKGGVGKTWLSITLAHALARANRRCLLFDGDLGLANVDVQLGLMPDRDLASVLAGTYGLREAVFPFEAGGIDMIAGHSGSGTLSSLAAQILQSLRDDLMSLSADYDFTIIDLGAGIEAGVRIMAERSDTILVLVTDEPTALTDAYAFIKVMRDAQGNSDMRNADMRVVVNMAENKAAGEKTYETLSRVCSNFLGFKPPLAGVIEADGKIKDSIRHQTSILTRYPQAVAAHNVELIAARLMAPPLRPPPDETG